MLAALPLALPLAAAPQGGWTKDDFPELGLKLAKRPKDYEQLPLQPGEDIIVLHYALALDEVPERHTRPELLVLSIDLAATPAPRSLDTDSMRAGRDLPIDSIERWVDARLGKWSLGEWRRGKRRGDHAGRWSRLEPTPEVRHAAGWLYAFERPAHRTVALLGLCDRRDYDEQSRLWRTMAERLSIYEPAGPDLKKLRQHYARRRLRDPEYRIGVRAGLVRGWKAEDTENYIVVSSTRDEPLLRLILRNIEAMREVYVEEFPPAAPIQAVSTLRVCKDEAEYLLYGGQAGTGGHWNPTTGELVMYDAVMLDERERPVDDATFMVLYHEAFHQFIHHSAGSLAPHSWFDEGTGDYFGGTILKNGKVHGVGLNAWRAKTIRDAVRTGRHVPWSEIVQFDRETFYRPDQRTLCYAQAWSMVHFLRTSRVVAKRPEWARIPRVYFETLQASFARGMLDLVAEGKHEDERELELTRQMARNDAHWEAFSEVDLDEIERAWASHVLELDVGDD